VAKANRIRDRGRVQYRHEAGLVLERPGDMVLIDRGVLRSFVMCCPDGCGETITINLDPRTDKAWRYYKKRNQISVFPSVWRDTGCRSHFIIWNHCIVWCDDKWGDRDVVVEEEDKIRERVLSTCTRVWQHFTQIAAALDEVPWDVNRACKHLAQSRQVLEEGKDNLRGSFRLRTE
jgi:hypothetical protein